MWLECFNGLKLGIKVCACQLHLRHSSCGHARWDAIHSNATPDRSCNDMTDNDKCVEPRGAFLSFTSLNMNLRKQEITGVRHDAQRRNFCRAAIDAP